MSRRLIAAAPASPVNPAAERRGNPGGDLRVVGQRLKLREQAREQRGEPDRDRDREKQRHGRAQQRPSLTERDRDRHPLDRRRQRRDDHRTDHRRGRVADDPSGRDPSREDQQQPKPTLCRAHVPHRQIHRIANLIGRPRVARDQLSDAPSSHPIPQPTRTSARQACRRNATSPAPSPTPTSLRNGHLGLPARAHLPDRDRRLAPRRLRRSSDQLARPSETPRDEESRQRWPVSRAPEVERAAHQAGQRGRRSSIVGTPPTGADVSMVCLGRCWPAARSATLR